MGKRLEGKRKISDFRTKKKKEIKRKIIIAIEGKNKTERLYFNNFDDGKQSYSISIARGNDTDPINLVNKLAEEIHRNGLNVEDGDIAYCVFDTDIDIIKNNDMIEARKIAKKNNIKIITSSPCIELWFLLHFEYTTGYLSNTDVYNKLKKYISKYEKNMDVFPFINKNVEIAIVRAKQLEKHHIENGKKIGTVEANPNTEIYKIIEDLNMIKKRKY